MSSIVEGTPRLRGRKQQLLEKIYVLSQNEQEACFATNAYFAREMYCGDRAIQQILQALVALGLVEKDLEQNNRRFLRLSSAGLALIPGTVRDRGRKNQAHAKARQGGAKSARTTGAKRSPWHLELAPQDPKDLRLSGSKVPESRADENEIRQSLRQSGLPETPQNIARIRDRNRPIETWDDLQRSVAARSPDHVSELIQRAYLCEGEGKIWFSGTLPPERKRMLVALSDRVHFAEAVAARLGT